MSDQSPPDVSRPPRTPSTRGLVAITIVATVTLALGSALAFRPAATLALVPGLEVLVDADPRLVVVVVALTVFLLAPVLGITGRTRTSPTTPLIEHRDGTTVRRPSSHSTPRQRSRTGATPGHTGSGEPFGTSIDLTATHPTLGASFDSLLTVATAYEDESRAMREKARTQLIESLRSIAANAYANRTGCPLEDAHAAIADGSWSDDPRARALLADESGPSTPWLHWLYDLCTTADPFVRALEQATVEIDGLQSPVRRK